MGALRKTLLVRNHEDWCLFTNVWLHSGVFQLIINLVSVLSVGIHLEQEVGPCKLLISTFMSRLFITETNMCCVVFTSFCSLVHLVRIGVIYLLSAISGSMVAALFLQDRPTVTSSGTCLDCLPDLRNMSQSTAGLFEYELQHSFKLRQKLDRPVLRSVFSVLFRLL
ncbi:hypothetical protein ACET3Z_020872 [Daucus carota]